MVTFHLFWRVWTAGAATFSMACRRRWSAGDAAALRAFFEGYGSQGTPPLRWPMEGDGPQEMAPPTSEDTGTQDSIHDTYYEEAEGSTAAGRTAARTAETWSKVEVRKTRHLTRGPEYSFTTNNNHVRITGRDDWQETEHKGRRAWYHRHKGVYYYTREKP